MKLHRDRKGRSCHLSSRLVLTNIWDLVKLREWRPPVLLGSANLFPILKSCLSLGQSTLHSALPCSTLHLTALTWSALHYTTLPCSTLCAVECAVHYPQYTPQLYTKAAEWGILMAENFIRLWTVGSVHCSLQCRVLFSAIQCSAMQRSAVQYCAL